MAKEKVIKRDTLYWLIYNNVKAKHEDWPVSKLHAVTNAMYKKQAA